MSEDVKPANAHEHAKATGDGSRAPLPPMPAPKKRRIRRIPVKTRAPFLPHHHGHARHGLRPHKPAKD